MNTWILSAAMLLCLGLPLRANAAPENQTSAPTGQPTAKEAETSRQTPAERGADNGDAGNRDRLLAGDPYCLQHTGTRIRQSRRGHAQTSCNGVIGRSYDREALERTGAFDLREALRRLDPALF